MKSGMFISSFKFSFDVHKTGQSVEDSVESPCDSMSANAWSKSCSWNAVSGSVFRLSGLEAWRLGTMALQMHPTLSCETQKWPTIRPRSSKLNLSNAKFNFIAQIHRNSPVLKRISNRNSSSVSTMLSAGKLTLIPSGWPAYFETAFVMSCRAKHVDMLKLKTWNICSSGIALPVALTWRKLGGPHGKCLQGSHTGHKQWEREWKREIYA